MKQFYKSFIAVAFALAMVLASCDSDETGENGNGNALPKIVAFKCTPLAHYPSELLGNNHFSYDSEGRVVSYTSDVIRHELTYSDNNTCKGISTLLSDQSVMQTQDFELNDKWMPTEESVDYISENFKGSGSYEYNEKYRITYLTAQTDSGNFIECMYTYDSSTGLISEVKVVKKGAGIENLNQSYCFEYSDRDNPVAFYPENLQWFDFEPAFSFTGQTGYYRNKLLDKVWVLNPEGKKTGVFLFKHDFSAEGKLTAIHQYYSQVDENGTLSAETLYIDYTEISY